MACGSCGHRYAPIGSGTTINRPRISGRYRIPRPIAPAPSPAKQVPSPGEAVTVPTKNG